MYSKKERSQQIPASIVGSRTLQGAKLLTISRTLNTQKAHYEIMCKIRNNYQCATPIRSCHRAQHFWSMATLQLWPPSFGGTVSTMLALLPVHTAKMALYSLENSREASVWRLLAMILLHVLQESIFIRCSLRERLSRGAKQFTVNRTCQYFLMLIPL